MIPVDILYRNHSSSLDSAVAAAAADYGCDDDADDNDYDTDDYAGDGGGGGAGAGDDVEVNSRYDNSDSFRPCAAVVDRDAQPELVSLIFDDKTGKRSLLPKPCQRHNSQEQHNYTSVQLYHLQHDYSLLNVFHRRMYKSKHIRMYI